MSHIDFTVQTNKALEHCTVVYIHFYNMFRPLYSAIMRQKHKYVIGKLC
jgi:hypothetical protein